MNRNETTTTRARVIQGEAYTDAGFPDFAFQIPQPFLAEHFEALTELGIVGAGFANAANQLLAENLGNNMAGRIKKAIKDGTDLPTQAGMDELYAAYDFSGVRISSLAAGTLYDKIMFRNASQFIRRLIKKTGYQNLPAPVTVAKKGAEPDEGQISYDVFEDNIGALMRGEGPWGEVQAFIDLRDEMVATSKAEEERVRESEKAVEGQLATLTLGDSPALVPAPETDESDDS